LRKTIDTNVLVRALVDERNEQSRIAGACLTSEFVHVPVTVMLETEWVLRSGFGLDRESVCNLLASIMSLPNVEIDLRETVGSAIIAHRVGFDFADALHLQMANGSECFLTFDQKLLKLAVKLGSPVRVQKPKRH
jgi:predicted nucleic-acid-binding protein